MLNRRAIWRKISGVLVWDVSHYQLHRRIGFIALCCLIAYATIIVRLVFVATSGQTETVIHRQIISQRQDILDRNGTVLATTIPTWWLCARPEQISNKQQAAEGLAKILGMHQDRILSELNSGRKFVWLKYDITSKEEEAILALGVAGLSFEQQFKRLYTHSNLFSHVIGYVNRDNVGLGGMERYFDAELSVSQHIQNKPLKTTLDANIQYIVSEELDNAIAKHSALGGAGVVIDPNNGDILAMISKPDFNPHTPSMNSDALFNKASLGMFEFGSVMKILTVAVALDTQTVALDDRYDITSLRVANFNVQDFHHSAGMHTVAEIFAKSSNKGTGKIAINVGASTMRKYFGLLGLDKPVGVELHEKIRPFIPDKWSDLSTVTISYGYGIATSILHLMQAIVPAVNGGMMYPLRLIDNGTNNMHRVLKQKTSDDMKKLLRLVVTSGTGRRADIPEYLVGGKSGTSNKIVNGHYQKNSRISSFIGVMPAINPKYLVYIMLDNPQPTKETGQHATGGVAAAPVVKNIFARIGAINGIDKYNPESYEVKQLLDINT